MKIRVIVSPVSCLLLVCSLVGLAKGEPLAIESVDIPRKLADERNCYVVGYFKNLDSAEATNYRTTVAEIEANEDLALTGCDDLVFGISSDDGVKEEMGIEGDNGIVESEGGRSVFKGVFNVRSIKRWIEDAPIPLVSYFHEKTVRNIFRGEAKNYLMLIVSRSSDNFPALKEAFTAAARQFRGKTSYIIVDTDDKYNVNYMSTFVGFRRGWEPAVYAATLGEHGFEKFLPDFAEITTENIVAYNAHLLDGGLKRYLKSEEIPEDWDARPVKVLVGKNFHEVIKSSGKSAFVLFTSPWSPYCKRPEPIWAELGEKFVDSEKVLLAKINSVHGMNEIDGLHINGEPTMLFFDRNSTEVVEYNGEQTLDDLVKFVNDQIAKEHVEL